MNKEEVVLAGLATAKQSYLSPVKVQKLFFLIDKNIAETFGGPFFDFKPYNYGPFDKQVYTVLEVLATKGLVEIAPEYSWKCYRLTEAGQSIGEELLAGLPELTRNYILELVEFVKSLSFSQLVSAIYKAYPDMRANSVFQE